MFLAPEEVFELTGYQSRACQRRWCAQNGVTHFLRADGSLVISRQHVEERLGASSQSQARQNGPDFSSLE